MRIFLLLKKTVKSQMLKKKIKNAVLCHFTQAFLIYTVRENDTYFIRASEKWFPSVHFYKNASQAPHVNGQIIWDPQ